MREIQRFGEYTFEATQMVVMRGIDIIDLPHRQREALALLLKAEGKVVDRDAFLDTVWRDVIVEEHNLTQTIFLLRKALGKLPSGQEYIETVPKKGYRISLEAIQQGKLQEEHSVEAPQLQHQASSLGLLASREMPRVSARATHLLWFAALALFLSGVASVLGRSYNQPPRLGQVKKLTRDGYEKVYESPIILNQESLLFTELRGNRTYLADAPIDGGMVNVTSLPEGDRYVYSARPARNEVLLSNPDEDGPITSATLKGVPTHSVGELYGHGASWSPDGTQIAYAHDQQILLSDNAGQNRSVLAPTSGHPFWIAWSPDGKAVRYSVNEADGQQTMYEVSLATHNVSSVLKGDPNEHHVCCGSWSNDGKYFVYIVENSRSSSIWGRREKLFSVKQGGPSWQIASGPIDFWRSPTLSPDTHHLYAAGEQRRFHLAMLDQNFEPLLRDLSISSLSVSHDGQWIAYTAHPEGVLFRSRLDGTERVQISESGELASFPQWSPDDQTLIYVRESNGERTIVRVDPSKGKHSKPVGGVSDVRSISYSPVAEKIAFDRQPGSSEADGISILSLGNLKLEAVPASSRLSNAKWSPDARYLSALSDNQEELKIFDTITRTWLQVAAATAIGAQGWDRGKNVLYYMAENSGHHSLMKYVVAGAKTSEVKQIPERYADERLSNILEVTPAGGLLFGYSEGEVEVYDISVDLP